MNNFQSSYIYVPSLIISFLLATYIFVINKKDIKNIIFSAISFSAAVWLLFLLLSDTTSTAQAMLFWSQIAIIPPAIVCPLLIHFSTVFPKKNSSFPNYVLAIFYSLPIIFAIFAFTPLNVISVSRQSWGTEVQSGLLYIPLIILLFGSIIFSIITFIRNYNRTTDAKIKSQILYVLVGLSVMMLITLLTNGILVAFGVSQYGSIGTSSILIFLGLTVYAMVKSQLFDVRVILTEAASIIVVIALLLQTILANTTTERIFNFIVLSVVSYGAVLLIRSVQHEIKQRQELAIVAQTLKETNEKLKEVDKLKDDFLSMASHELNTPIAAIEGYLSMILVEKLAGELPAKAKTYLDSVFMSAKRLAHLVKDLLNVSRIESGRVHIIWEQKPIEDMIDQAVMEVMSKAREAKHTLTFEKPKTKMPLTWFDVTRITEILINMLGNSIKYTPDGGKITVRCVNDDGKIVVSVEDNGKGIPKDKGAGVFEKFTQVDVLKDEVKGTGLGMYIAKKFIELMGGKIWFHSDGADKGTTFYFSIPIVVKKPFDPHEGEGQVLH